MRNELLFPDSPIALRSAPATGRAGLVLLAAVVSALLSAGVCAAAVVAPAPAIVLPLIVAVCVGCPIFSGWHLAPALAAVRLQRTARRSVGAFRATLRDLPEVDHPLGL